MEVESKRTRLEFLVSLQGQLVLMGESPIYREAIRELATEEVDKFQVEILLLVPELPRDALACELGIEKVLELAGL